MFAGWHERRTRRQSTTDVEEGTAATKSFGRKDLNQNPGLKANGTIVDGKIIGAIGISGSPTGLIDEKAALAAPPLSNSSSYKDAGSAGSQVPGGSASRFGCGRIHSVILFQRSRAKPATLSRLVATTSQFTICLASAGDLVSIT